MLIADLITHYRRVKSLHSPLPPSLEDKLHHIDSTFGAMPASSSGEEIVNKAKLRWRTCAPGTMKRYLVQLKAVLRRAEIDGLIPKRPHIDLPYVYDVIYVDISASEVAMLLDFIKLAHPRWYPLAMVLSHTGARLGEALSFNPEMDLTKHGIRLRKAVARRSKTIERIVPLTARMEKEIASGLFLRPLLPAGIERDSVASCFGRVLDDATEALNVKRLRVHDLRHAFAAVLAEAGADLADLASALGHTNIQMSMRYRGLVKTKLTALMQKI